MLLHMICGIGQVCKWGQLLNCPDVRGPNMGHGTWILVAGHRGRYRKVVMIEWMHCGMLHFYALNFVILCFTIYVEILL